MTCDIADYEMRKAYSTDRGLVVDKCVHLSAGGLEDGDREVNESTGHLLPVLRAPSRTGHAPTPPSRRRPPPCSSSGRSSPGAQGNPHRDETRGRR